LRFRGLNARIATTDFERKRIWSALCIRALMLCVFVANVRHVEVVRKELGIPGDRDRAHARRRELGA
jgi:hypothetical protein